MSKLFLLLTFSLVAHIGITQPLSEIRKKFHQAVKDPSFSEEFERYISEVSGEDPVIIAYKAVAEAMVAQDSWNPINKISRVTKFSKMMEKAVSEEQCNIEIRFLRFAVEYYLPPFLMMSKHLEEDRDFLITNMTAINYLDIDQDFARYILYFMNETGMVPPSQMAQLKATFSDGQ